MSKYFWPVVLAIVALLFLFGGALVTLYTDWMWFMDLGYGIVFTTILLTRIKIGLLFGLMFFLVIYGNLWYARRIAPPPSAVSIEQQLLERLGRLARRGIGLVLFLGSIVLSVLVGLEAATHWESWLRFSNAVPFGASDPLFHRDIGFYVFQLPFLDYLYHWLFFALAASAIAAIALHYADEAIELFGNRIQFAPKVKTHLSVLLAAMFFLKAWGYKLGTYKLLSVSSSLFDGPGYTEIHANLPALKILMVIAVIGGVFVLINIFRRGIGFAIAGLVALIGASVLVGGIYPSIVQSLSVKPNELEKQRPYITRAIKATQEAYALNTVTARQFAAESSLTADQINANSATIENIRLWDQDHLMAAYNQIQTIQQYYHFGDMDVDRYWLADTDTGKKRYRQVWLAARELDQTKLPDKSQTWVNLHLQYTHGYGYAMSPVNEVDTEGLPHFFVKDIPPIPSVDLPIKKMGIYFGELTDNYVFVNTSAPEFDYPSSGGKRKATAYTADAGIKAGGLFRKAMFAFLFSDVNILLNENIKSDSRILFRRNIQQRVEKLMPFLQFDDDPYLVTVNGGLYWIRDAYTITDAYPYSSRYRGQTINYIRNSVKIVVNAYTGEVDAYTVEKPLPDAIIKTYEKIFPGIFKPLSKMPAELREHIRYPEDMFRVQTDVYARYHYDAKDTDGFYRNSDLWEIPSRANLTAADGGVGEPMEPYFVIMKLPNGEREEFLLMTPYIRAGGRKNMVAWICARCDQADFGRMVLYKFPEDKSIYGPQQVAGRASQDTVISQQLSLWDQQGSSVGSGNLMVVPIESSFLYVMPVYLVSTATQIPELKRVIVSLGNSISMEPTLPEALSKIVGAQIESTPSIATSSAMPMPTIPKPAGAAIGDVSRLVDQAATQYQKAESAQRAGNWAEYGRQTAALKQTLTELKSQAR